MKFFIDENKKGLNTDKKAPYDLVGSKKNQGAKPFDLQGAGLVPGLHELSVEVKFKKNTGLEDIEFSAAFYVPSGQALDPGKKLRLRSAVADEGAGTLTLQGFNFDGSEPVRVALDFVELLVLSATDHTVVADLPAGLASGSYVLHVSRDGKLEPGKFGPNQVETTVVIGAQGPQGEVGPAGPQGEQGLMGAPGAAGPQGPVGPAGAMGPMGPAGANGLNGVDGATGPQGAEGPQGAAGADGQDGATGAEGAVGPQGEQGDGGPMGPAGADGATGPQGEQGPMGLTGPAGADGADGLDGADGAVGPQGPIGLTGAAGADGQDGATGAQGPAGADGAIGMTGPQGPIGLTGPAGAAGADGVNGLDGAVGPQGPIGPMGADGQDGQDGATGPQGPIGVTGAAGADGQAGADGATGAQGPAGADGATGMTGPQGPIGLTGPAGADGVNGVDGAVGPQGPIGLTGPAGADGATGMTGPQGPIGLTGPAGADGADGVNGLDGATGPQGPIGLTGAAGATGADGQDGADGATGAQGPAGADGATGMTGPQGPIGLTGPAGADGADGVNGLDGATGPQGPAGVDGAVGPQGPIGLTGADGADGATGMTGPQGPAGADGAVGPQGPIGLTGAAGADGVNGLDGATGPQGPAGVDGAVGPQGPIGLTGADGADGATGMTGPQGPAGADGAVGPQGPAAEIPLFTPGLTYSGTLSLTEGVDTVGLDGANFVWSGAHDVNQEWSFGYLGPASLTITGSAGADGVYLANGMTLIKTPTIAIEPGSNDPFRRDFVISNNNSPWQIGGIPFYVGGIGVVGSAAAPSHTTLPPFGTADVEHFRDWMIDDSGTTVGSFSVSNAQITSEVENPFYAGPMGPIGETGPVGATGATGPGFADASFDGMTDELTLVGVNGAADVVLSGLQGPVGPQGPQGVQGPHGETGIGLQGVAGPQGPVGPQGPAGPAGGPGYDGGAYDQEADELTLFGTNGAVDVVITGLQPDETAAPPGLSWTGTFSQQDPGQPDPLGLDGAQFEYTRTFELDQVGVPSGSHDYFEGPATLSITGSAGSDGVYVYEGSEYGEGANDLSFTTWGFSITGVDDLHIDDVPLAAGVDTGAGTPLNRVTALRTEDVTLPSYYDWEFNVGSDYYAYTLTDMEFIVEPGGISPAAGINNLFIAPAIVAGGEDNTASGTHSAIPGGRGNSASGSNSFAAGTASEALDDGAFVWSDSRDDLATYQSTGTDTFNVYAQSGTRVFGSDPLDPALTVTGTGRVGIGTDSPETTLHVATGGDASLTADGYFMTGSKTGANIVIDNNEIMARNNGQPSSLFLQHDVGSSGHGVVIGYNGTTFQPNYHLWVAGDAAKTGGGEWSVFSDARLKKNVADLEGSLDTLLALRGVTFEYKDPDAIGELHGERIGFIAQEVEQVIPDWVDQVGEYKSLTIRGFSALAVEALRELDSDNAELEAENDVLQQELAELRAQQELMAEVLAELMAER